MDAQRRAEITGWDAQEFSDGFAELRRLADRELSGAVTNGTGWLFVFEGRVVGTVGADLDAFADASGTIYQAPADVLPVLFAMQERGGEPRAQYYTNDTALSKADRKLSQGGFTGYIELSENVLSGDYYVTYTAGESMAVAYVGNSRRLETDDDAFELADDEVGIYTVYEVELDVREIPDGGAGGGIGSADESPAANAPADASTGDSAAPDPADPGSSADGPASGPGGDPEEFGAREDGDDLSRDGETDGVRGEEAAADRRRNDEPAADRRPDDTPDVETATETPTPEAERSESRAAAATAERDAAESSGGDRASAAAPASEADGSTADSERGSTADSERDRPSDDVFSEEEQWREQKSIPALDPSEASDPLDERPLDETGSSSRSRSPSGSTDSRRSESRGRSGGADTAAAESSSPEPRSTERNRSAVSQRPSGAGQATRDSERVEQLQAELQAAKQNRKSLKAERDELAETRDELTDEVDRLKSELSTLRDERDQLQSELSTARDRLPESDRSISAAEARSGTNLFVRYESKGGATLEDAHDGAVGRDGLRENLRIEHHTSFETDGLVVEGRPYEEFLTETIEYGFTRWLVEELPFEVSGTGNDGVLKALYDALPEVDRAEIGGSVSIALRENGEETREQRAFDLVLRDRMGNPLFVADLNDSRDPTPEGTLESLVGNGRDIAESNDPFAATFAVTESFFEPGALETASDAVGGGLFSRSKRASFVKLSRKRGFHLCLVEARDGGFHMTVPDL